MKVLNPDSLINVLTKAAIHTRNVMTRDHIIPESSSRAGQFSTSLRSALDNYEGGDKRDVRDWFTSSKNRWSDVLVLNSASYRGYYRGTSIDESNIVHIIEAARSKIIEINPEVIDVELSEIKKKLDSQSTFITRAQALNREASTVLNGFNDLTNKIEEQLAI